jgi:hypothetical protein
MEEERRQSELKMTNSKRRTASNSADNATKRNAKGTRKKEGRRHTISECSKTIAIWKRQNESIGRRRPVSQSIDGAQCITNY